MAACMRKTMVAVAVAAAALWAGCGGRSATGRPDDAAGPGGEAGADAAPPGKCVIAQRVDDCCTPAIAVTESQLKNDPCLVFYPARQIPAACKALWPSKCKNIKCSSQPPPTRLANPAAGGGCAWGTECHTAKDCELAMDARNCCQCTRAFPSVLVASEDCIEGQTGSTLAPPRCSQHCPPVSCKPCGMQPAVACVAATKAGLNVCSPSSVN